MKRILITGGSGFIGRNLKEQLILKYEIFTPTSKILDLLNEEQVKQYLIDYDFDIILHTATWNATVTSPKDTTKVLENNLKMFFNLTRCDKYFGKMIYYGSGAEYDRVHWLPRMSEEYFDLHVPSDQYGFSKYLMRKFIERTNNIYNLCLFGVFGKYEDWQIRFISNACCKAVFDLPISINQKVIFDYLYIDDLIRITEWFFDNSPSFNSFNVCSGKPIDLLTLAKKILKVSGKKNLDIIIKKKGWGVEYTGNNNRLLKEMGGFDFCNINRSIKELYKWYDLNRNQISKEKLSY